MRQCLICLDDLDEELGNLLQIDCGCKIKYHKECLLKWLRYKKKCPICKQDVLLSNGCIIIDFRNNTSYPTLFYTCIVYGLITIFYTYKLLIRIK